jgi:formamidopyrimidine-DNA glycosylase
MSIGFIFVAHIMLLDRRNMTEGPEATFLAEMIYQYFREKRLQRIRILGGRYKTHGPGRDFLAFQRALPLVLTDVYKKGKVIFLIFGKAWTIIVKMGMTGWFYRGKEETDEPDEPNDTKKGRPLFRSSPNVTFEFEHDTLQFFDFRNFGTLTFTNDVLTVMEEMDRLAPDVLNPYTTYSDIRSRVPSTKGDMSIAEALMDQTLLMSGIGNILKSEILYDAGISPRRAVKDIQDREWPALVSSAKKISKKTLAVLQKRTGDSREEYDAIRRVYDKQMDPHGHLVRSYSSKGRTTYYVPEVQRG